MKAIKNCNGKRIKDCGECEYCYIDLMGGIDCKKEYLIDYSFKIPVECCLPDWRRTLEVD